MKSVSLDRELNQQLLLREGEAPLALPAEGATRAPGVARRKA
jgi:hypothetical protein